MKTNGSYIEMRNGGLIVPDEPVIPFIEGDGIGPDIWRAASSVLDAAVRKAYDGRRQLVWKEVLAGGKGHKISGSWLPDETIETFRRCLVGIKGPLATPVGGGIRSLNVALRQVLDLYVCLRPVRYSPGIPSPVSHPEDVDMVVFRENTEDVYAGYELEEGTEEARELIKFCKDRFNWSIRPDSGIGLKPISESGSKRLIRAALDYAVENNRRSVTLVHKGNIQKFTEGAFRKWGYELAKEEYADKVVIKDTIADIFFQQVLTRPKEFDVIATMNLNGDYISDALAAQVGGVGIAPGGNINYTSGHALFEATHGTAPKYAGQDKVNPGSLLLSGEMLLRYIGWEEAADLIIYGFSKTIQDRTVTYDLERLMPGATLLKCSEFADAIIKNLLTCGL